MDALYQYNPKIFSLMNLDATSEQAEMDEMVMNNQMSHMVTSITEQQEQLQQKIYTDLGKQTQLQQQIRSLQE